jgi:hypothetical protein
VFRSIRLDFRNNQISRLSFVLPDVSNYSIVFDTIMDVATVVAALTSSLGLSAATAAWLSRTIISQRLTKDLEFFKSELERGREREAATIEGRVRQQVDTALGEIAAEREYASEAKKRLYTAIGPLRFQLLLACRDLAGRIQSATVNDYSFNLNRYYGRSTLFRILRPLALGELIERQVAYADFSVDSGAIELLRFKKNAFAAFSGDSILKGHKSLNWNNQVQHVFFDYLSSCTNAMIIRDGDAPQQRAMRFHEFEELAKSREGYEVFDPFPSILQDLTPQGKPLFWTRLIAYGYLCNNLINILGTPIGFEKRTYPVENLLAATKDPTISAAIQEYVVRCQALAMSPL